MIEYINKTFTDDENNEWLICPICKKQLNYSPKQTQRMICSKNLHHVFGGAYKQKSEKFGYMFFSHPQCHLYLHTNPDIENEMKIICQKEFLKNHSEKEFIKQFGKMYE